MRLALNLLNIASYLLIFSSVSWNLFDTPSSLDLSLLMQRIWTSERQTKGRNKLLLIMFVIFMDHRVIKQMKRI